MRIHTIQICPHNILPIPFMPYRTPYSSPLYPIQYHFRPNNSSYGKTNVAEGTGPVHSLVLLCSHHPEVCGLTEWWIWSTGALTRVSAKPQPCEVGQLSYRHRICFKPNKGGRREWPLKIYPIIH